MTARYLAELFTPAVLAAQRRQYGRSATVASIGERDELGPDELDFIARRDSFYLATVTTDGWPYLQHRGGAPGFLLALSPRELAFADLKGNRQLISTGNLSENPRASLFLMDYPHRSRLKILGHARVADDAALLDRVAPGELRKRAERAVILDVVGFDWNCPAYITPRYTEAEIREAIAAGWEP